MDVYLLSHIPDTLPGIQEGAPKPQDIPEWVCGLAEIVAQHAGGLTLLQAGQSLSLQVQIQKQLGVGGEVEAYVRLPEDAVASASACHVDLKSGVDFGWISGKAKAKLCFIRNMILRYNTLSNTNILCGIIYFHIMSKYLQFQAQ